MPLRVGHGEGGVVCTGRGAWEPVDMARNAVTAASCAAHGCRGRRLICAGALMCGCFTAPTPLGGGGKYSYQ